jgi:hypothetical protein
MDCRSISRVVGSPDYERHPEVENQQDQSGIGEPREQGLLPPNRQECKASHTEQIIPIAVRKAVNAYSLAWRSIARLTAEACCCNWKNDSGHPPLCPHPSPLSPSLRSGERGQGERGKNFCVRPSGKLPIQLAQAVSLYPTGLAACATGLAACATGAFFCLRSLRRWPKGSLVGSYCVPHIFRTR